MQSVRLSLTPASPVSVVRRPPTRPGKCRGRIRLEIVDRPRRRGTRSSQRATAGYAPSRSPPRGRHACTRRGAVGNGVAAADEELLPGEPPLERGQRGRAGLVVARERLGPLRVPPGQPPEARRADVRLEQVLLEEHPGVDVRPLDAVVGRNGVPSAR